MNRAIFSTCADMIALSINENMTDSGPAIKAGNGRQDGLLPEHAAGVRRDQTGVNGFQFQ